MTVDLCLGGGIIGKQCSHKATWKNISGVKVCDHHKLLLDAFTWESRKERKWEKIEVKP